MSAQLEMLTTGATPFSVRQSQPEKREQRIHENSRAAYREGRKAIGHRAMMVYEAIKYGAQPVTDRHIMNALGFTDMNAVRPRITELIDAGMVSESGKTIDYVTGKKVRTVICN